MRDSLIKFFSSVVLFLVMIVYYYNQSLKFLLIVLGILCVVKFVISMVLEPDNLFEIIKKFIYLFFAVGFFVLFFNRNFYLFTIIELLISIDTLMETIRFRKVMRVKRV